MVASHTSAVQPVLKPHLHVSGQQCPFCEQDIPPERLEEINGRIAARAQERVAEATARLRDQYARERAQTDAKAKAELEQVRREAAAEAQRITTEAAAREAVVREQATRAAEQAVKVRLEEAERVRKETEAALQARIAEAETARAAAEQAKTNLSVQLEQVRTESATAIRKAAEDAAAREAAIRADAAKAAEAALLERIAAAEVAKNTAEEARLVAEAELRKQLAATGAQLQGLKEAHAAEINSQREALEKDKIASVNAERVKSLETKMKLEEQLQDMTRQLQKRTADELGEGAELELHDVLKEAFESDKIRRVQKGTPGADIVHEIVHNGKVCGKIVYDSKNRNIWKNEYAAKLRQDQIAEKADHAILSSNKFPAGAKQLHLQDHVIVACPARVLALAELLRNQIVQMHELRISNEAREEKTAALYEFITSEQCGQLLDSVEHLIRRLEQIEVDEEKAHRAVWKKRGELLKSVLKANGDLCFAIDRIIGTAEAAE